MLISMLKNIKIFKGTPTCFNLNRSSSGSRPNDDLLRSKHVGVTLNTLCILTLKSTF